MSKNNINLYEKESDGDVKVFRKQSIIEVVYVPTTYEKEPLKSINGSIHDFQSLNPEKVVHGRSSVFLYVTVFIVNLLSFSCGAGLSWTSPVIPKLKSATESPLNAPLDPLQVSWIVSILTMGQIVGPFLYGYLADQIGRKKSMIFCCVPIICGLIILAFAHDVRLYYFARFLHGVGIGGMFAVGYNFVAEIGSAQNRGLLSSFIGMFVSMGATSSYAIGSFLTIKQFCLVLTIPPVLFLILFSLFAPDSPVFLIMNNKEEDAVRALKKFRRSNEQEIEAEIYQIKEYVAASHTGKTIGISYLIKNCRKAFIIGLVLSVAPPLVGMIVVMSFLQAIFQSTGDMIDPKTASIIVGIVKFMTTFVTSAIIENVGRKVLLLGSSVGLTFANFFLGCYFYIQISYPQFTGYIWWLPLTCLLLYFISFNLGIGSVNFAYQSEIFPSNVRSLSGAFNTTVGFSLAFVIAFIYPLMSEYMSLYSPFYMFAGFSAMVATFIYFYLPETRGKTLIEIQELLN